MADEMADQPTAAKAQPPEAFHVLVCRQAVGRSIFVKIDFASKASILTGGRIIKAHPAAVQENATLRHEAHSKIARCTVPIQTMT